MSTSNFRWLLFAIVSAAMVTCDSSAAITSDISAPAQRRAAVETASRLADLTVVAVAPKTVINPFNPAAFNQPDAEELRAIAAARAAEAAALAKNKPKTGAELLDLLAQDIAPSGTVSMGGEEILIIGPKQFRVGDRLAIKRDEQTYDVEIAGISHSTFTLRLNHDEITRRIQPRKNP